MKKSIYAFMVLFAMSFTAFAQEEQKAPEVNNDPNAPEIVFEKEVHDFGTIPYGGNGTYDFKFSNTGKSPLIISNARGSCGCTVPKWPKEPVGKGQSGSINVQYDTKRPGPFTKTVTISSNAKSATKVITIKGTVEPAEQSDNQAPVKKESAVSPLEKAK
jgi:hypothetical protein